MKYLVSWRTIAGTEANRSFDSRESLDTFVTVFKNNWKSFSLWTFEGDQAVAQLTPLV